ncbi:MAG TPA: hypothetical protein DD381_09050 [Lentisphaeria bacterium]|nr:MAG: hypothetical protein A2X47_07810 [Lentisphaerae bacterium GWF2_38_69]HBM16469.1 hypothetical protein [Lentisphaeria bacterium]
MDISKYKLWTEFDWVAQLSKEENNLNAYFEELEKHLDLPNEDDLIYAGLKSKKMSEEEFNIREEISEYFFEEENELDYSGYDLINKTSASAFYFDIGKISTDLCMDAGFSTNLNYQSMLSWLMVSGRAMSLYMDFLQLNKDEFPELKKAILKSELAMLNVLVGILGKMHGDIGSEKIENYLFRLYKLRENLIELRFAI